MTNLEKLRTATPKQIADMLCKCLKNCSACPHSFRECCSNGEKNGFEEWLNEETIAPEDAPEDVFKGWVKLKTMNNSTIRIDASKIVALGPRFSDAAAESTGAITKVYTIGAECNPWLICDSVDEVMRKIKKALQEK